jgi:hypothetical protein
MYDKKNRGYPNIKVNYFYYACVGHRAVPGYPSNKQFIPSPGKFGHRVNNTLNSPVNGLDRFLVYSPLIRISIAQASHKSTKMRS